MIAVYKKLAVIREAECIGCTKCIKACPVDAILGSGKSMHTVLTDECTGCELCVAPCPVDCIDIITRPEYSEEKEQEKLLLAQQRTDAREKRLSQPQQRPTVILNEKKSYVQAAILRAQARKLSP